MYIYTYINIIEYIYIYYYTYIYRVNFLQVSGIQTHSEKSELFSVLLQLIHRLTSLVLPGATTGAQRYQVWRSRSLYSLSGKLSKYFFHYRLRFKL